MCLPRHPAVAYLFLVRRIRMKSDEPDQIDFVPLGRYAPREAAKLLAHFEETGIPFRMQPRKPAPQPGPTAAIDILKKDKAPDESAIRNAQQIIDSSK